MVTALMLVAVGLTYANSLHNEFEFDDFHTINDNPAVRSLDNLPRFFTDATTFSVLPPNRTYRPVVSASLALDYALGHGYDPLWFHLSTLLWFLVLVGVLSTFYRLLLDKTFPGTANVWLGLFAAAWFGLHPAMAETVNYIIQRGDLYCTLGCVAALFLYARYPALRRTGLYLLPFVLAMLSKPPAAGFPVVLVLYVYFFEDADAAPLQRLRRGAVSTVPAVVVTALLLWLQSAMTPKSFTPTIVPAADYRLTQPLVWLRYAASLLLPVHLNVDSDLGASSQISVGMLAGMLFVAALLGAVWMTARQRRLYPIAFGLLWFIVTQLPTSLYPLSEVENDHRMFFSFVGLVLATVWGAWLLWLRLVAAERRERLRPALIAAVLVVLCGYAYGTVQRNIVWHTPESLWRDDVQKSPRNGRGLMNYGVAMMSKGAYPQALDSFTRALEFTPNYATLEINLGIVNGAMASPGDTSHDAEAERHFLRAISLAPGDDASHAYYGRWLAQRGRTAEAIAQLRTAVALDPPRLMQRDELIQADLRAGDTLAARQMATETLALAPDDATAQMALHSPAPTAPTGPPVHDAVYWVNESLRLNQTAQYESSIAAAHNALKLDPGNAVAWNNIAADDASLRRWDDAIAAAQKAVALQPDFQLAKNNLAWALSQKKLATR
jgi:tetratricopeptide (TPR) repeat protein